MPMLFRFSVTSALWLLLCSFAVGALAAPSVSVTNILRLQPGWVRVYLQALDAPLNPQFGAFPTCASPTSPSSITATVNNGANLAIDFKVDPTWLADNGLHATQCRHDWRRPVGERDRECRHRDGSAAVASHAGQHAGGAERNSGVARAVDRLRRLSAADCRDRDGRQPHRLRRGRAAARAQQRRHRRRARRCDICQRERVESDL